MKTIIHPLSQCDFEAHKENLCIYYDAFVDIQMRQDRTSTFSSSLRAFYPTNIEGIS
jgi:hypothetical protein